MVGKPPKADLESFLEKLNKDTAFRNKFLDHPAKTVKEFGFDLSSEDLKMVDEIFGYLKNDIKHIFEIPAGYSDRLEQLGFGIKMKPEIECGEPKKIIP